jgi:hypothetical protein
LLNFTGLSHDANFSYVTLTPVAWFGSTCSMYPIIDGKVEDPRNDFGFGTNLTVAQFKTALRNKIYSITHP